MKSVHEGVEALLRAFSERDLSAIGVLADTGLDLDGHDSAGLTVLIRTVLRGDTVGAEWVLAAGADADATSRDGKTALDFARQLGLSDLEDLLLLAGAGSLADATAVDEPEATELEEVEPAAVELEDTDLAPVELEAAETSASDPPDNPETLPTEPLPIEPPTSRVASEQATSRWDDHLPDQFSDAFDDDGAWSRSVEDDV